MIPDWQLPPGVDRGLHDYMRSEEMVAGYDDMMSVSALAQLDVQFCLKWLPVPGCVLDLGCGTGRLARPLVERGNEYLGVDLSEEMLKAFQPFPGAKVVLGNLVERQTLPEGPFDSAACLFSTLGMIRGAEHRRTAIANTFQLLKPGGRFVLHVHNRFFRELGLKSLGSGDITMPQAYGGAPLTLHHFGRREAIRLIQDAGFRVLKVQAVAAQGELRWPWLWPTRRAYGYLIAAEKPS